MPQTATDKGYEELRRARRASRGLYWAVGLFSVFVNLLMLTGPLYMLQVYDRVLGSGSEETLVALSLLVVFLFTLMGILDFTRGRVMARVGARFQDGLDYRVFEAALRRATVGRTSTTQTALSDLESVQRFMTSPVLTAFFDAPWTPLFLMGIALFHPWLGLLAIVGGGILIIAAVLNQVVSKKPLEQMTLASYSANQLSSQLQAEAEMVSALGMREAAFLRWQQAREKSLEATVTASDVGGIFTTGTKTFRLFLQSAMLGLGAYLALKGEITPGAMIAGSILLGRALAPVEMAVNQWAVVQRARRGWHSLAELLGEVPPEGRRTKLPEPAARLHVQQATIVPPGESQASLRMISFEVEPGEAVGVIGSSGAGKSTLAKAITGVWRTAGGKVRLDGAALEQYDPTDLGNYIGYLPQRVELFDGTIAENISRLAATPDAEKVVAAAQAADAHDMILKLPEGYDTQVTSQGGRLSGGQIQRIGLARAMYGDPVILVLDEPNSNLDNEGSMALNSAIRVMKSKGCSVLIMAHRPAAIQECDKLLVLDQGARRAFGPRDAVLKEVLQNYSEVKGSNAPGGVQ
ncbi:type I secretion system permease/ATPase [Shimia marina]|uniref:Type I secretion system ATP-binding protein PrsD n=1 Tax=Shimia marina TaxID=321267 RepID=A0A0P1ELL4_9RHOB|nr:type I secretion system permease/ATPase [Shimia marina]CUH51019.1 Type I secretion system ATP-binding protein PrsD [Shimia marina]SFD60163.1 ATP-binding cassette, subfamily C [Shimia marina]